MGNPFENRAKIRFAVLVGGGRGSGKGFCRLFRDVLTRFIHASGDHSARKRHQESALVIGPPDGQIRGAGRKH
jgi:hypothetical protein